MTASYLICNAMILVCDGEEKEGDGGGEKKRGGERGGGRDGRDGSRVKGRKTGNGMLRGRIEKGGDGREEKKITERRRRKRWEGLVVGC